MKKLILPAFMMLMIVSVVSAVRYTEDVRLRVMHLAEADPVNVWINDQPGFLDIEYGEHSEWLPAIKGWYDVKVTPATSDQALLEDRLKLNARTDYTVVALGTAEELEAVVLKDRRYRVKDDESRLRFFHAAMGVPEVDVDVKAGPDLFNNIKYGEASHFARVPAGMHVIEVYPGGSDTPIEIPVDLMGKTSYTLFVSLNEGELNTFLVEEDKPEITTFKIVTKKNSDDAIPFYS